MSVVLVFIVFLVVLIWLRKRNSNQKIKVTKGFVGESMVKGILKNLPDDYYAMHDLILEKNQGSTQIDHVVVSKYGVFVIETKNYIGKIYGNDDRDSWTQIILTDVTYEKKWWKTYTYVTKNKFYNPVRQNLGHVYEIKKILKECSYLPYLPVVSIVVFSDSADISGVKSNNHVINMRDLIETIMNYDNVYLPEGYAFRVIDLISSRNDRCTVDKKMHVQNVQSAMNKYRDNLILGICPRCGGALQLRSGKYGNFYGCSNYPKCKFTKD